MDRESKKKLGRFLSPSKKELARQNEELAVKNEEMTESVQEMKVNIQELRLQVVDVLSATMITTDDDSGNPYTDKSAAVEEIISKYQNASEWGCQLAQKIINQRKALVIPFGVDVQPSEEFENVEQPPVTEIQYIKDFLKFNGFPQRREDDLSRQSEMEGQCLITLHWDEQALVNGNEGMVTVRRLQWSDLDYTIHTAKGDVDKVVGITWQDETLGKQVLTPDGLVPYVLAVFNGTTSSDSTMQGMPPVAFVLAECENLDKALKGWRKVNRYFANLTPFFESEGKSESDEILARITAAGWKVGKAFVGRGMQLVGPESGTEVKELIYGEIRTNAQVISGTTGIPVHHLGFADVIGQGRATAQTMMEPMEVIAINDMGVWHGFYKDLFDKVIQMRNERSNVQLREGAVVPKLLPISATQWNRIEKIWLPATKNKLISKKLFLKQLPNVDVEEEMESLLEEFEDASLRRVTSELDSVMSRSTSRQSGTDEE